MNNNTSRILRLSGGMHLDILISRLKMAASQPNRVQEISCMNAHLEWIEVPLLELLQSCQFVKKLEFLHCQGIESILNRILSWNDTAEKQIRIGTLSCKGGCNHLPTAQAIGNVVRHANTNIQRLELNDFFTCPESIQAIGCGLASPFTKLQFLDISNSTWPSACTRQNSNRQRLKSAAQQQEYHKQQEPLDYLIQSLSWATSLKGFSCEQCRLPDAYVARLVWALKTKRKRKHQHQDNNSDANSLETLNLRGNSCQRQCLQALTSHEDSISCPSFPSLQSLMITNEELSEDPIEELQELFRCLPTSMPKLQTLILQDYMIPVDYMKPCVNSVRTLQLSKVAFLSCGMTTWSVRHLSQELHKLRHLKSLSLPDDGATNELLSLPSSIDNNYHAATGGLVENTNLQELNMAKPLTALHEYYLDLNRGGRRLLCWTHHNEAKNNILYRLWPTVLERAQRIKYYYTSSSNTSGSYGDDYDSQQQTRQRERSADVIYTLLRNRILLEQR